MISWELFADWHTHTSYSDGQGTIAPTLSCSACHLSEVAITDHAPANLGAGIKQPELTWLQMQAEVEFWNQTESSPRVLLGAEANIISRNGDLDVPKLWLKKMDIVIASLHPLVKPANLGDGVTMFLPNLLQRTARWSWSRLRNMNTKALTEAVHRYEVDFVAHPGLWIDIDTYELACVCARRGTALEINCHHVEQLAGYVQAAMPTGVDFVINSDAHTPVQVGQLETGRALANALRLPPARIRNAVSKR